MIIVNKEVEELNNIRRDLEETIEKDRNRIKELEELLELSKGNAKTNSLKEDSSQ